MRTPNREEFNKGIEEFKRHEKRDGMYRVATFLVSHFWGKPADMADGLGVLLLTWNQAFYRYGIFNLDKLEKCISKHLPRLEHFRERKITGFSEADENEVRILFNDLLDALQIDSGKKMQGRKSPVAVAKALHLLAPNIFPLWDDKIARVYQCYYNKAPAEKYISFSKIMNRMASEIKDYISNPEKPILKLIDEYNYSKFTQRWI